MKNKSREIHDEWMCERCKYLNENQYKECIKCKSPNPKVPKLKEAANSSNKIEDKASKKVY